MGTAILASDVPKGKIYATAAENVVLYYIPVTSADMAQAFDLTADATGLIGIHTGPTYDNLSAETVAASGVGLPANPIPRGLFERWKQVSRLGLILLAHLPARRTVAFPRVRPLHGYWDSSEIASVFP